LGRNRDQFNGELAHARRRKGSGEIVELARVTAVPHEESRYESFFAALEIASPPKSRRWRACICP
jgi:hypothetical protein